LTMMTKKTAKHHKPCIAICSSQRAVRVPRKKIHALVEFVAAAEGLLLAEIDLAIVDRTQITSLNRKYLRHSGSTDVLCFDLSESSRTGIVTQLVVCGDIAAEQAALHGLTRQAVLLVDVGQGLPHLAGYVADSIRGAARMHAREDELLDAFRMKTKRGL